MNARYTTMTTLLASLSLVITTGCAPATEVGDEEATQHEGGQELRGALGDGVVTPREYVGPVTSCPAGQVRVGAVCFRECGYGLVPSADGWCDRSWQERPRPLVCAQGLEYINGSCYRRGPAGSTSRGILGCEWGA